MWQRWLASKTCLARLGLGSLALLAVCANADIQRSIQLDATQQVTWNPVDNRSQYNTQLSGQLKLNTRGSSTIKSYLHVTVNDTEPYLALDKLYSKMRWGSNRIALGKTTLGWGQGATFNAGDVAVLPNQPSPLMALSIDNRWLGSWQHPLGRFSFYEIALVAPATPDNLPQADVDQYTLAARHQFQMTAWNNNQIETGIAWQGTSQRLMPYFSLQGGSGLNWHVSARAEIDQNQSVVRQLVTAGLYGMWSNPQSKSWNYRIESVWDSEGATSEMPNGVWYRHMLQGSLSVGINSRTNAYTQVMLSPVDQSFLTVVGAGINFRQGFTLNTVISVGQGDSDDLFSHRRSGAVDVSTQLRYLF